MGSLSRCLLHQFLLLSSVTLIRVFSSTTTTTTTPKDDDHHHNTQITSSSSSSSSSSCTSYSKVQFNQTIGGQYIEYEAEIPDLTGFTLHYWIKILQPTTLAPTFSYLVEDSEQTNYVQVTLLNVADSWYGTLQVNGVVVSNTKLPDGFIIGQWHHLLHSWNGQSGIWSIFLDGILIEQGTNIRSKDMVVKGGGRSFTGQQGSSIVNSFSNTCSDIAKFQEGVDGWITLLSMDTRAIVEPSNWINRMAVAVVAAGCHVEHKGDVISWIDTPRRSYCGVLDARANNICGAF